jgi:GNAT superfamily N-acetyltransferase
MQPSANDMNAAVILERLDDRLWCRFRDAVETIENSVYEPARRDTLEDFDKVVLHPRGVSVIALAGEQVAGFCLGAPLECFPRVGGVLDDPRWGEGSTLYSVDTTVVESYRGRGIARQLKVFQLDAARASGYGFVAGRNRVGYADAMWTINRDLGAVKVQYLEGDYPDRGVPNACNYYHICL